MYKPEIVKSNNFLENKPIKEGISCSIHNISQLLLILYS